MSDDALTDDSAGLPDGTPAAPSAPTSSPELAAVSERLNTLTAQLHQATNPQLQASIVQALQSLGAQVQELKASATPRTPAPQGSSGLDDPDFQDFYADPTTFIDKRAASVAKSMLTQLAPHLRTQAEQIRDALVTTQAQAVESEFGPGTWDEHFRKEFETTIASLPLEMQSSREHVDAAVSAVFGRLMRDPETFAKMQDKRRDVQRKRTEVPRMMTGARGRSDGSPDTLSADEKDFLASLQRSGINYDAKQYLAARKRGNTESAWRPTPRSGNPTRSGAGSGA